MSRLSIAHRAAEKDYSHFELAAPNPATGKWEINFINVSAFFVERGYSIYRINVEKWILIRIIDNIVKHVGKKDLSDELINYITNDESPDVKRYMHQYFLKNISKALADDFLQTLPAKDVIFKKDKRDAMQFYFQNTIVKITKDGVSLYPYTSLDGYIWESQIIPRDFTLDEVNPLFDFEIFINNIGRDPKRIETIRSAIGFMIHNYKHSSYCPAIILNDEIISDNPEGGTGKGIIFRAISYFINVLNIDGKTFSFDSNFLYQRINTETRFVIFQDVNKNFDFERLFSFLTEGVVTEKKGKDQEFIPFEDSPKVGITTNYAVKGAGNSHERRRFEIEISQHYNKSKTPETEFGHMLFDDWGQWEWSQFDNYIIECAQIFLRFGLVKQDLVNLPEKRLLAVTNSDFLKYMREIEFDFQPYKKGLLINGFMANFDEYTIPSKFFSRHLFTKWVVAYADFHGYKTKDERHSGERYYEFEKVS
ncbi:MAG TPA: primase-helicase family protein [Bacteroidia bacterium]|nr:primase-helicase family protein [Bacteroidia bacterium]